MLNYFTYISTNSNKNILYTGTTDDLKQCLSEHFFNNGEKNTFAGKHSCYFLLYYEAFDSQLDAIARKKELKAMRRKEKVTFLKENNPEWSFLNNNLMEWPPTPDIITEHNNSFQ